jgi:hypothetical protein
MLTQNLRGRQVIHSRSLLWGFQGSGAGVRLWLKPNWSYSKAAAGKMNLYESFAQATQLGDLHTCLMMDMKACQEDDVRLLCHLTPSIYTEVCASTARVHTGVGGGNNAGGSQDTTHLSVTHNPTHLSGHCFPHHSCLLLPPLY